MLLCWQSASANELKGTWVLVSGEYVDAQGELVSYVNSDMQSLKVLSEHHFSFTSMKGDQFWASATGTYQFSDGQYVESLLLNSFGEKPGVLFAFQSKVEGDNWYNSRWKDGLRVEYEVWRRQD